MSLRDDVEAADRDRRAPLIRVISKLSIYRDIDVDIDDDDDDGEVYKSSAGNHPWLVYFSTLVAVCGSYQFGAYVGYSSPTQSGITEDLGLSTAQYSLFGSIVNFGAMVGGLTSGKIADLIGRKSAMVVYCVFCIIGWIAIFFAQGAWALDLGRIAGGYGMGAFSYVVPIYIAEIAPTKLRGTLTTLHQVMISSGVSIVYILGIVLPWRVLALSGLIPCALQLFGIFFIPESPRWLAKRGEIKEFEVELQRVRGDDADITSEAAEILSYIEELQQLPKSNVLDIFRRRYRRSVIISIGLMVFQQIGGISGISAYASSIFVSAGFSSNVGTTTYACIQVAVVIFGANFVDKAGRKPLLLVSALGMIVGSILAALSFYFKAHEVATKASPILALFGILVYSGSFPAGMGAVPWIVMAEILPLNIKGTAGSIATAVNWLGSWLVSYTFNFLMGWSSYGIFLLYAATNALAIVFVILVVPETKGRTLEEIQGSINTERDQ